MYGLPPAIGIERGQPLTPTHSDSEEGPQATTPQCSRWHNGLGHYAFRSPSPKAPMTQEVVTRLLPLDLAEDGGLVNRQSTFPHACFSVPVA